MSGPVKPGPGASREVTAMRIFNAGRMTAVVTLTVLGLWGLGHGEARAVVTTSGCANVNVSCTLAELFAGGSIQANDKLFNNWGLERNAGSVAPNLGLIDVIGLDDGGLNPGPGLRYNGNGALAVVGGDFIDLAFNYGVWVLNPPPEIVDNSLEILNAAVVGDGFLVIDETVFDQGLNVIGNKHVEIDPAFGTEILFDELEFDKMTHLVVEKAIFLDAGFFGAAALNVFEQRFSQAPEPGTLALFGVGLVALGFMARRNRRRTAQNVV